MKYWIERFTNRVTMEKLILYCLFAIFVVALLLSSVGALAFSPLALLASFAVLVFASYGLNLLFGYLFAVGVSYELPVITALILGFLVTPSLEPAKLAILFLIALVAVASKFLLVLRGRHIFNPAAIAVVLVGLTGLQYATWWVATPPLLPIVALGAFLILYKTRHLLMGTVFLLVSAGLITASGLIDGAALSDVIAFAVLSWPIVFFAGYMLTEPMTLPPRRWQKLLLAALAGIGVALPFSVAGISSSPEIILVLINIVAFVLGQRRGVRLTLKEVRSLTPTAKEFVFTSQSPIRFQPGQYMEINLPQKNPDAKGTRRSFSIVGVAGQQVVALGIKMPENLSSFKQALVGLQPGTVLTAMRVGGDFLLSKDATQPLLFIAGGIGITPFVSHIRSLQVAKVRRSITLIYAVASSDETAYIEEFIAAGATVIVVSSTIHKKIEGVVYVDAAYLTEAILREVVPGIEKRYAYVSGPPLMVNAAVSALKKLGAKRIKKDYFNGY